MKSLVLGMIAALAAVPAAAEDFNAPIEQIITGYIRPATAAFAETASSLPSAVTSVCDNFNKSSATAFQDAFSDTVRDFSRIHFLRFGPLLNEDRLSRLAFMPDPRGIGQRQIRKLYAEKDARAVSLETLQGKSVALQGLTALQLVAFDKDGDVILGAKSENTEFTCTYAASISENISSIAEGVASDWSDPNGYSSVLLSAGPDNERFRTAQEALETVFNNLLTGLVIVRDQDILPALGSSRAKAKPRRFPFSRSGNSVLFLSGELGGLHDTIFSLGLQELTPEGSQWVFRTLSFEFNNAQSLLQKLQPPLRVTLNQGESYAHVKVLAITVKSIRDTLTGHLAGALGLAGGFNALDGD